MSAEGKNRGREVGSATIPHRASVPLAAYDFFARNGVAVGGRDRPMVSHAFHPATGWRRLTKAASIDAGVVRQLQAEGVTHVTLEAGGYVADFWVEELARH